MPEPWRSPGEWTVPGPQTLDLWRIDLTLREEDWGLLTDEEAERARRIIIDGKRDQKAAARARLREILARYVKAPPGQLVFEYGEHGKPSLAEHASLSFNLSHSEQFALLGVTRDVRIGVDVEHARDGRAFADIAERFFSPAEYEALMGLEPPARPRAFYRAWTRKEAYLKAWGTGLTFASNRFTITYLGEDDGRVVETQMPGDEPGAWTFVDLSLDPEFPGAACYEGPALAIRQWDATRDD